MSTLLPEQSISIRTKLLETQNKPDISSVVEAIKEVLPTGPTLEFSQTADQVVASTCGLGPLEEIMSKPNVTDVLVNRFDDVWFDQGQGLVKSSVKWNSESELRQFASRLATNVNRRLDDVSPFVDAQLSNGIRFHAIIPPLATQGTAISFRIPSSKFLSIDDLVALDTFDQNIATILKKLITNQISFAVSGSTGSGKTTFLGAMLGQVNDSERILVIEDSSELKIDHPHVVTLQTRNENSEGIGTVELKSLIKQALRMRPDRLVIGEVRGAEVLDLLISLNTGHSGGCVTIHANDSKSVLPRIEALALLAKIPKAAIHALLKNALQVLIHIERTSTGRKLSEISVLDENEKGELIIHKALDLKTKQAFEPGWQKLKELTRS